MRGGRIGVGLGDGTAGGGTPGRCLGGVLDRATGLGGVNGGVKSDSR